MSLKEAKKLVDSFKDKLDLAITKFRDQNSISSNNNNNNNANNGGVIEEKSLTKEEVYQPACSSVSGKIRTKK